MKLEIISAHEITFSGEAASVTLPGAQGSFTVLKNHAPLIAVLNRGVVKYSDLSGNEHRIEVAGGIADINSNVVSVCVY